MHATTLLLATLLCGAPVEELAKIEGINLQADGQRLYYISGYGPYAIHALGKASGAPDVVLVEEPSIEALAQSGDRLYWTTRQGQVRAMAKEGGAASTLFAGDGRFLGGLIAAGQELLTLTGMDTCDLLAISTTTGKSRVIAAGLPSISGMAVSGDSVFLGINKFVPEPPTGILRVALSGKGKPQPVTTEKVGLASLDEACWAVGGGVVRWFAKDAIHGISVAGKDPLNVPTHDPSTMAVDGRWLYWHDSSSLWRLPLRAPAGAAPELVAELSKKKNVRGLLLDEGAIYLQVGSKLVRVKRP